MQSTSNTISELFTLGCVWEILISSFVFKKIFIFYLINRGRGFQFGTFSNIGIWKKNNKVPLHLKLVHLNLNSYYLCPVSSMYLEGFFFFFPLSCPMRKSRNFVLIWVLGTFQIFRCIPTKSNISLWDSYYWFWGHNELEMYG